MTASCPELVHYFRNLKCNDRHEHLPDGFALGRGYIYSLAEAWTWQEASKVADGMVLMINAEAYGTNLPHAYPIDIRKVAPAQKGIEPHPGRDFRALAPRYSRCRGFRSFRARNDWGHNRVIGECSYPYDELVIWKCQACLNILPREKEHTMIEEEC